MSQDISKLITKLDILSESLDPNQKKVGQLPADFKAGNISPVVGTEYKQHPADGKLVGENMDYSGASFHEIKDAIHRRINYRYPEIYDQYPSAVIRDVVADVASFHEGGDLGTSDVSIMVREVLKALESQGAADALDENAEELNIGDDVIITGNVQYHGKTGVIKDFGRDKRFVVVNLYNYGPHSFHSSDVSFNDYADSSEEEEDMYDRDPDARKWDMDRELDESSSAMLQAQINDLKQQYRDEMIRQNDRSSLQRSYLGADRIKAQIRELQAQLRNNELANQQGVAEESNTKEVVDFSEHEFDLWQQQAQSEGYDVQEGGNLPGSYDAYDQSGQRVGYFRNKFDLPNGELHAGKLVVTQAALDEDATQDQATANIDQTMQQLKQGKINTAQADALIKQQTQKIGKTTATTPASTAAKPNIKPTGSALPSAGGVAGLAEDELTEEVIDATTHPTHGRLMWLNHGGSHMIARKEPNGSLKIFTMGERGDIAKKWAMVKNVAANQGQAQQGSQVVAENESPASLLAKLARVVKSVRTPAQYDAAKKYANLVFDRMASDIKNKKGFAGLNDQVQLLNAIKADLHDLRKRLWPVNSTDRDVRESSDYSRRRQREEDIISGKKPARKKAPAQTSDYAKKREKEKKLGESANPRLANMLQQSINKSCRKVTANDYFNSFAGVSTMTVEGIVNELAAHRNIVAEAARIGLDMQAQKYGFGNYNEAYNNATQLVNEAIDQGPRGRVQTDKINYSATRNTTGGTASKEELARRREEQRAYAQQQRDARKARDAYYAEPKRTSRPKLDLDAVWRKVEDVVGQTVPDGDPIDWLAPWLERQGVSGLDIGDVLRRAARKNGYRDMYEYYNEMVQHYNELTGELGEGLSDTIKKSVKHVKRGMQGWDKENIGPGGEQLGNPKDIVRRNKSHDDATVQRLHKSLTGPGPGFPFRQGDYDGADKHSPAGLQKRVLDREMKKRNLGEGPRGNKAWTAQDQAAWEEGQALQSQEQERKKRNAEGYPYARERSQEENDAWDRHVEKLRQKNRANASVSEDVLGQGKKKVVDCLNDPVNKQAIRDVIGNKMKAADNISPVVKTIKTDDGHEIKITGTEDDGFRISIKDKAAGATFNSLDEAVMACEMYCAHRRNNSPLADYLDEQ